MTNKLLESLRESLTQVNEYLEANQIEGTIYFKNVRDALAHELASGPMEAIVESYDSVEEAEKHIEAVIFDYGTSWICWKEPEWGWATVVFNEDTANVEPLKTLHWMRARAIGEGSPIDQLADETKTFLEALEGSAKGEVDSHLIQAAAACQISLDGLDRRMILDKLTAYFGDLGVIERF